MDIDTAWMLIGGFFLLVYLGFRWVIRAWIRPRWHRFLDRQGWNDYTKLEKDDGSDEWVSDEQLAILYAMAALGLPAKATQIHDELIRTGTELKGSVYHHLGDLEYYGLVVSTTGWVEVSRGDDLDPGSGGYNVTLWRLNVRLPRQGVKSGVASGVNSPAVEGA